MTHTFEEYEKRLWHEIEVIKRMGYAGYQAATSSRPIIHIMSNRALPHKSAKGVFCLKKHIDRFYDYRLSRSRSSLPVS